MYKRQARSGIRIGTGGTVGPSGSGIVTYFGDGSQLTGISAGAISAIGSDGAARVLTSDGDGTATAHSFVTIESNRLSVNRGSGSGAFPLIVRRTDASGIVAEFSNSGGYGVYIGQNGATGEGYIRTATGQPLVFTTNAGSGLANERLRITSDGKMGFGTNSPDQKLHVYESSGSSHCYLHVQNNRSRNAAIKFTTTQGSWLVGQGIGVDADRLMFYDTQQRMGMDSSGNMTLNTGNLVMGTSGKGISFAATGDSAGNQGSSEILDDYEEGTWTPAFKAGNNSNASSTSVSEAKYTRIGRLVHCVAYFTMNSYASGTTGGDTRIVGLPYTGIGQHGGVSINYWWGLKQNVNFMAGTVQGNTSEILIRATTSAAVGTANIDFDNTFESGDSLILTATYFTS